MKRIRLSFLKRIFALFCCTVLLSSSVFASYSVTVYAVDAADVILSAASICLTVVGLIGTGGAITLAAEISVSLATNGKVIHDYVKENSDGTYTISEEFIQAVIDTAEQLEAQGFTDADVKRQGEGYLETYKWTVTNTYMYGEPYKPTDSSRRDVYIRSCEVAGRVAGFNNVSIGTYSDGGNFTSYTHTVYGKSLNVITVSGQGIYSIDGKVTKKNISASTGDIIILSDVPRKSACYSGSSSFGGNFPIFSTYDAMSLYIHTGQGYKDAENYRAQPFFRRHSSYTPTYSGGPVTVNRTVIQNVTQKIEQVDADDTKTDDEKIDELRRYILSGGDDGGDDGDGGGGSGGGGNTDYDDNKDLPAGTDLADTNSWLKKIYLKVCQIFDKMTSSAEKTFDDVVNAISGLYMSLKIDEIIKYLKEITGDLDDIKGQLAEMSEQEFTEKTGEFLDDTMLEFSEIGEKAKNKFPFSIPNDIKLLISKMSVSPPEAGGGGGSGTYGMNTLSADDPGGGLITVAEGDTEDAPVISGTGAPIFYLPLVIESAGIEEYIKVDLSGFDPISKFCRSLMTIWFVLCLYNLTFKVIGLWGDLVD